jgi:asparagine synthase (glutamine-hydrolysing)
MTAGWLGDNDERKEAENISKNMSGIHIGFAFNKLHMMTEMENTIRSLDDLRAGHSWSNYLMNKHISKHVRITVQGTGADELFGGYGWRYTAEDYAHILDKTKLPNEFLKEPLFIPKIPKTIFERYQWDVDHFLNGLLIVGDRLSSAFGIEERVPFLDNRLAEYALSLSPSVKQNKSILRNAMNAYDISTVKRGFGTPDKLWMSDPIVENYIREELKKSTYIPDYVDMDKIDSIIEARNYPAIWSLLALHYWIKIYADGK